MPRPPHLNQPGGRFLSASHPHARGRERELRAMTDAVRRLIRATVTHHASAEETTVLTQELEVLAAKLESHVPEQAPDRYFGAALADGLEPHDVFPYDYALGLYNPIALPVEMTWEPPQAVGRAHFDDPYEGPPGCVHGAVLAAVFDQVFNVANLANRTAGPTANLTLDYKRPTPLRQDLVFKAHVASVEGRKIHTVGHVEHGGEVCVEAQGLFILVTREHNWVGGEPDA